MSKKPSDATLLRQAKSRINDLTRQLAIASGDRERYRTRATKTEIEASDWRKRFDLLLAREPQTSGEVSE